MSAAQIAAASDRTSGLTIEARWRLATGGTELEQYWIIVGMDQNTRLMRPPTGDLYCDVAHVRQMSR